LLKIAYIIVAPWIASFLISIVMVKGAAGQGWKETFKMATIAWVLLAIIVLLVMCGVYIFSP
jgi:hypothetical protein